MLFVVVIACCCLRRLMLWFVGDGVALCRFSFVVVRCCVHLFGCVVVVCYGCSLLCACVCVCCCLLVIMFVVLVLSCLMLLLLCVSVCRCSLRFAVVSVVV